MRNVSGGLVLEGLDLVQRYILALLGAREREEIPEKLWLQKELFLLSKLRPNLEQKAEFVPHLKGPFSDVADEALKDLQSLGLVDFNQYGGGIHLTAAGKRIADEVETKIPKGLKPEINEIKEFLNSLSEDELLVFTYYTYPEMVIDSVVKERISKVRIPRAVALYRKGKVSLEKAAELAGLTVSEFKRRAGGVSDPE